MVEDGGNGILRNATFAVPLKYLIETEMGDALCFVLNITFNRF